jgi:hypothetical protein
MAVICEKAVTCTTKMMAIGSYVMVSMAKKRLLNNDLTIVKGLSARSSSIHELRCKNLLHAELRSRFW